MTRCIFGGTASFALLLGTARPARADGECARLSVSPEIPKGWTEAVQDLTRQLAALPPSECRLAMLSVETVDGGVRLVAVEEDGRRAERRVAQPSMLVPIALGLVISIPTDRPTEEPPPAPSAPLAAPAPAVSPRSTEVWLGLGIGGRIGAPSSVSMIDIEARADLRIDQLLLFVSFRDVPIGFVASEGSDSDAYGESSIAFGVGRTFRLGSFLLDLAAAPTLVAMRLGKDGPPKHIGASDAEFRLGVSARLSAPLSKTWRLTMTADTDIIPEALRSPIQVDPLPAFPAWTGGLRIGASGAVL